MLHRFNSVIANLVVYPENMMRNLNLTGGLVFSQRVLLELPLKGVSREDAYRIVQRNAMKVWEGLQQGESATNEKGESLYLQYLLADEELRNSLSEEAIRECFNFDYILKTWIKFLHGCLNNYHKNSFFRHKKQYNNSVIIIQSLESLRGKNVNYC